MKRIFLSLAAAALCSAAQLRAEEKQPANQNAGDSVRMYRLQEVEVTATRATPNTPVAYSDIRREEIARNSYGTDIPTLLALTPSMIATNETGIGIGGTAVRLRGTDPTRLNVTINGVAMNNPDSHSMYWYDTPDLISAVGTMQVQRGAGISTNGTGAFGGAVNMTTESLTTEFSGEASLSYGSYNTNKQAVGISSGLMGGHWAVDARLTHIGSDGYIDRGSTDLKSYLFQGGYYNGRTMVKLLSFGGKAKTYLTYNGVTEKDMERYGRRYHDSGQYSTSAGPHVLADGSHVDYYDDQTDNYLQINNQIIVNHRFNDRWALNATGFYTYGYGYYKQYKDDAWLMGYTNLTTEIEQADLIREKIMRNHLGGLNASASYAVRNLDLNFGGSWSYYSCPHWGELDWVDGMKPEAIGGRWYDNDVDKQDANLFVRANWRVAEGLRLFADVQYRYVHYEADGTNDNFDWNELAMQPIDVDKKYHFFNPRAGVSYTLAERHNFRFSAAIAQKEPTRNDFTDRYMYSGDDSYPASERLYDYELGYQYTAPRFTAGVNLYYMNYRDQLVSTGLVNDGGDALNINVPDSYRRGIELSASWRAVDWFTVGGSATFSQNRIEDYVDHQIVYDNPDDWNKVGERDVYMGTTTIAFSPSTIANAFFDFHYRGFEATLHTQYVSKQYFTNNEIDALSLDAYCVTNLNLGYTLRTRAARSVRLGLAVYNLFNAEYSNNGYGYSGHFQSDGSRADTAFYFPQAPLNVLANVTVKF